MLNKIFCIGFNKTGTSSMHQLFVDLGLSSFHGYYSHFPVADDIFLKYQCFSDGEMHDFPALDKRFPGSKFIVTTRRLDDWLVSRVRHVEYRRSIGATGPMRQEYEADPEFAIGLWVTRRLEYHRRVMAYFSGRADDLLVIDICSGADQQRLLQAITGFLGLEAGLGVNLPHENARAAGQGAGSGHEHSKPDVRAFIVRTLLAAGLDEEQQRSVYP